MTESPTPDASRSGPEDLTIRTAGEEDAPALARLWADVFPGERTAEERLEGLLGGSDPFGGLETCRVAEEGGRMVGGFRIYSLRMHLWGRELPVQGLAAVAVAPDARRRGTGGAMCREAIRLGREDGAVLSVLFPFRVDYYSRLGYVLAGELHRYRFPPEELPRFPEASRVRRLQPDDSRSRIPPLYEAVRVRSNGMIARSDALWETVLGAESDQVYGVEPDEGSGDAGLDGYLVLRWRSARSRERTGFRVRELVARNAEAYRALLGWISLQRDQARQVTYDALPGENFQQLLSEPRLRGRPAARGLWFESATVLRGPMVRILDLEGLLASLGVTSAPGLGELPLRVVTEMVLAGGLPGQREALEGWDPPMGLRDFRLMDVF